MNEISRERMVRRARYGTGRHEATALKGSIAVPREEILICRKGRPTDITP